MNKINGKYYPLWSQFVDRKEEWIGGVLEDHDMGEVLITKIRDIELVPNGKESAFFRVIGNSFCCGFGVEFGGIDPNGETGWLTFYGYRGHSWRIKKITHACSRPGTPGVLRYLEFKE